MARVCLTGGIACGKSLLSCYLNELGVETIDADDVAHELIPDPAERRRIAAEVFADPAKRRELEARIHPLVKARIEEFLGEGQKTDDRRQMMGKEPSVVRPLSSVLRIAIIPLLFEVHWESEYDIICCVASTRENQISRMMVTRGYTREEAESRLAAQLPIDEKAAKSHYVIDNNGTVEELKANAKRLVKWLEAKV
ncbi:MAG: dephospho-CoA kinase [Kiritimatiellae bacterium]|nr:dephospho-CoA kinase [Kiritimatiellia bacterium]